MLRASRQKDVCTQTALFIFVILSEAKDLCTCHAEGPHARRIDALKQPSSSLSS
jgi:hypothetical protein